MADITAKMVADLRSSTGLGMMDCKKALVEAQGDINKALEILRIKSGIKAGKLSNRTAADGIISISIIGDNIGSIVEVNCETDFVAKDNNFKEFVQIVVDAINKSSVDNLEDLKNVNLPNGKSLEDYNKDIIAKLGENISIRRFKYFKSAHKLASYLHGNRIGVIVEYEGDESVAKDICMHIVASRPLSVSQDQIDSSIIDEERRIYKEQANQSGKPIEIINKMVEGRVKKFLSEITLMGQNFVKNPDLSIEKFLSDNSTMIFSFVIFVVGEGVEKKVVDYASEVASVAKKV